MELVIPAMQVLLETPEITAQVVTAVTLAEQVTQATPGPQVTLAITEQAEPEATLVVQVTPVLRVTQELPVIMALVVGVEPAETKVLLVDLAMRELAGRVLSAELRVMVVLAINREIPEITDLPVTLALKVVLAEMGQQ